MLPRFAAGEVTGAMVLTEPDAGSDLQAVRLRAHQDEQGNWYLNGVKRFITNGCGEILLTLARSEPEIGDGRGLSLFISERSRTRSRSATWKKSWASTARPPASWSTRTPRPSLIGERQRGLITYVLALMNGARVGIAAQSLGDRRGGLPPGPDLRPHAAAVRRADRAAAGRGRDGHRHEDRDRGRPGADLRDQPHLRSREQQPPHPGMARRPPGQGRTESRKQLGRSLKRLNGMLTPMSKYYASEMCCRVADIAIQVLGGSGYMKDYAAERHLRDARITTIYEGTSQLQIVAAVRGVTSGTFEQFVSPVRADSSTTIRC